MGECGWIWSHRAVYISNDPLNGDQGRACSSIWSCGQTNRGELELARDHICTVKWQARPQQMLHEPTKSERRTVIRIADLLWSDS